MKRAKKQGQRRMMYASLSGSEKYHDLPLTPPSAQLLYCLMYPHTDDFGNLRADPGNIKRVVVPGFEWTLDEISSLLDQLWGVNLIDYYLHNNKKYLHITGFEDTQIFNHERVALCPPPVEFLQRSESCKSDVLERKDKVSKDKVSEGNNQPDGCPSVEKPVDKAFDKLSDAGLTFFDKLSDTEKAMAKGLGYKFINAAKVTEDTKIKIVRGLILLYSKWPDAPKFAAMHIHRDASSLYVLGAINACNARASPPEKWPEYFQACIHKHGAAISDKEWLQQQQDIKAGFKKIKLSDILPSVGESHAEDQ